MDCRHLSDAVLLRLIREGGEASFHALSELEQRHFHAVRTFAGTCGEHPHAAGELAYQAWQEALREQVDGSADGAVRPCLLSSVLRTASGWTRGPQRTALNRDLTAWIETNGPVMLGNTATAGFRRPSLVALAFAGLPHHSQTVLWHRAVERDDSAPTGRLAGAHPGEVPMLHGRAQEELFNSYARILRDGMQHDCRRFHVLVLAYSDAGALDIAAQLAPHLDRCPRCSQAVADLARVRHDCGNLLAQALLPWGGLEYAASRDTDEDVTRHGFMPAEGAPGPAPAVGPPAAPPLPANFAPASGPLAAPYAEPFAAPFPGPHATAGHATAGHAAAGAAGRGRHAGAAAGAAGAKGRRRADLVVRGAAVAGVCAVAAAFAFSGDFGKDGEPQSKEQASPPPADAPTSSKSPTAKPSRTKKPTPTASAGATRSRPPRPAPSRPATPPPSRPSVTGAAVEWLFGKVDGDGVTSDSSGNNQDGTLFGASRPTPSGGGLEFDGEQFVASDGALVDTSGSFSVSARVRLDRTDVSQTVLSQDGDDSSGFMLRYDAEETRWEMRMPEEDSDVADSDSEESVFAVRPKPGQWTQLTGVYDDADDQIRLYVGGHLGEPAGREDDFETEGNFVVGRGLSLNRFFEGLDGTVDDVRAFGRALSSSEAAALARRS
ncbi:LamG domain-containing protein [Streptomyces sp. HNM0575]|uniref:LamG domain-containing protein n=1 Tax=Streptomyces sp. HNM0575 TaxID=2716338 RepID=UPI00145F8ED7|nr:LamG domain-containing protein [Streptomyces sp. HNM0575]NLU73855.1 LamG domain-containing protein [Streptomyces sp. HNM0575]